MCIDMVNGVVVTGEVRRESCPFFKQPIQQMINLF